ncbi:M13 family metallopeptidase [Nannocystis sp. SCPEA4]|uniref:M13 family metallopeptidase n=1 Tax=Nannocystis sp. SCPEA4 TaxID=2996787 RepID=UPI00226F8071|nr:M13 family metallopeptidase [Nannocystis sp. SCPEA4]MCY1059239.1 M13 family metallopeptidase [Nannocystis sp. SCPEA4]
MPRVTRNPRMFLLAMLVGCGGRSTTTPEVTVAAPGPVASPAPQGPLAEVYAAMDPSVAPCDDFYRYACGGWLARNEIPADKPYTSKVAGIDDANHELLRVVLEAAAQEPGDDARKRKIGDFYAGCMDQPAIDAAGTTPLKPALAEIAKVRDVQSAYETAMRLRPYGVEAFVVSEIDADYKQPAINLLTLSQGGLGLPSREFYVTDDAPTRELLARYTEHVAAMLVVAGDAPAAAAKSAKDVVALETALATASLPLDRLREVDATYHKQSVAQLRALTPALDWQRVFAAAGNGAVTQVNAATPEFLRTTAGLLAQTRKEVLRAYLRWHLIRGAAEHLTAAIEAQAFAWTATLTGQRELEPRWRRCVDRTVAALPEAVGPYFVERAFAGRSKQTAIEMIVAIEQAFERGLDGLPWMDEATRTRARAKARRLRNMIGFPEVWRDDSQVPVDRKDYFAAVVAANRAEQQRAMAKVDQAVDPQEWFMPPSVLNAYTNPLGLEMVFPAGILQAPLFSTELPMAVNFGAIGSIMGHELTHQFDDQGRKFDETGALSDWWTEAASAGFEAAARCVVAQYDAYEALPGLRVRGQQTLGENIADAGGLKYAHAAYVQWAKDHAEAGPLGRLTGEQLLFVAFAQNYCGKETPEHEQMDVLGDVHSPRRWRAVGPLSHLPAFWSAFACAEGSAMRVPKPCAVW